MWFKNVLLYRFTKPFTDSAESLEEQLAAHPFKPCGSQEPSSYGWVSPLGKASDMYVHAGNGYLMVCAQRQERILPAAVVNEALEEKVAEITAEDERSVGRKERLELKDEIIFELMPKAFVRSNKQYAYIDSREGLLVINASSAKRAEELMNLLRESIGSLPVIPITANNLPQHTMTEWLLNAQAPAGFELGGECELRDKADENSVIRCKNRDLAAEEINSHLKAGMFVSKLALSWQGGIEFVVDDQLALKRLSFGDLIQEQLEGQEAEGAAEQFDVDFTIMTQEFSRLFNDVLTAFGGEDRSEQV